MTALDIVIANRAERYGLDPARVAQMYRELARDGSAVDHFVHLGDTLLHVIAEHSHDMMRECVLAELGDPHDKAAWLAEFMTQNESPFFRRLNADGTMGEIVHEDGEYIAAAWAPVVNIERAIVALEKDADFDESKHPRGQPENAGQFGPGGSGESADEGAPSAGGDEPAERNTSDAKNLTAEEKDALEIYAAAEFEDVNMALREGEKTSGRITNVIQQMDSAFASAALDKATTVYRVVDNDGFAGIKSAGVGALFSDKAFVSTAGDREAAEAFGKELRKGDMIEIRVPKGARAINMVSLSPHPDERELLLNRSTMFKIVSITGRHAVVEAML